MKAHGLSHIGLVRKNNQDRYLIRELPHGQWLFAVADGMGGEVAGEVAAQMVVDALAKAPLDRVREGQLAQLVAMTNRRILWDTSQNHPEREGMGSTLTAALVRGEMAYWVHVGDSRLYLYREHLLRQISVDQNLAQFLREEGELNRVEARRHPLAGVLEQAMGCEALDPVAGRLPVEPGDLLMLCSDGLYAELEPGVKSAILARDEPLEKKCELLIEAALAAGGKDNITVLLAQL
jgi:PPM family protein phosphatase